MLNQLGGLSDDDLVEVYSETTVLQCGIWSVSKLQSTVDLKALGVSADFLRRTRLLPLTLNGKSLVCAACDPLDDEGIAGLVFATGCNVTVMAARPGEWKREFDRAFGAPTDAKVAPDERQLEREIELVNDGSSDGGGARLVAQAFETAIAAGASDIHFEPTRHNFRVRLRVDGRLIDHQVVSADLAAPAVSRVKILASLNIAERRLPQDGRTTFVVQAIRN